MKISHLVMFLGGAMLGAIVALLLAPESGSETRAKINEKLKEKGINLSKEQLDEFIDLIRKKFNLEKDEEITLDEETVQAEEI